MKKLIFLITVGIVSIAHAEGPQKYTDCESKIRITPVANGSGVFFNETCSTAYVLPPALAKMQIVNTPALNALAVNNCATLKSYQDQISALSLKLNELLTKLDTQENDGSLNTSDPWSRDNSSSTSTNNSSVDLQKLDEYRRQIANLSKEINEIAKTDMKIDALTLTVIFEVRHQNLVQKYQQANPTIHFEPMPLQDSYLSFSSKDLSSLSSIPAALSVEVPGMTRLEVTNAPKPEGTSPFVIMGEALTAKLILSPAGACSFIDSQTRKVKKNLSARDVASHISANLTYSYALQSKRKYTGSYNIANLFRRLQTSKSSGGFFSTETINSVIIERNSTDWMNMRVESDDPRMSTDQMLAELKAELVDHMFRELGLTTTGNSEAAPSQITPKANGASSAAKELQKCPHLYCQISSGALSVADAIWGSSEASSNFISQNNKDVILNGTELKALSFYGTTTFAE